MQAGSRLAHYDILEPLGKGGMGEVYRARDTKLGRDVAIKALPEEFTRDAERLARFQREAKLLASLNHPNIAAIYGIEEVNRSPFLILELVEGETLAERLSRGALPAEESLKFAIAIADALGEAHEKGIIHRDLKPGNIKITPDGKVKVLDFGLAKAFGGNESAAVASNSPTMSHAATMQGFILGTAAYMAPEQAKGRVVTRAADIWAFGCVLYEMLAGRPAFDGEDVSEILASVIKGTTSLHLLPADLHPNVRRVIGRCLEKDTKRRFRDIGDVQYELAEVLANPDMSTGMPENGSAASARRSMAPWVAALAFAIVAGAAAWSLKPAPVLKPGRIHRFGYELPQGRAFRNDGRRILASSPDGSRFVFNATGGLYLRSMDTAEANVIPGTEEPLTNPVFSPDGEWVAFWHGPDRQLKKVLVTGGASVALGEATNPFGISWSADNTIVFGQPDGVWRVSANGGKPPERILSAQPGEQVDSPQILPNGDSILFTTTRGKGPNRWDEAEIVVASLKNGGRKTLWRGADGRYIETGHLIYAVGEVLYAVPVDIRKVEAAGTQVPIADQVRRASNPTINASSANYSISDQGTLVFIGGHVLSERALALVDRNGVVDRLGSPPKAYISPRLSPDGKKIAVETQERGGSTIWVYDVAGTSEIRQLTLRGNNQRPIWTPNGQRITFASDQEGPMSIYSQAADGSGKPERLTTAEQGTEHWPDSWSADGKFLSYVVVKGSDSAIWILSAATGMSKLFADDKGIQRVSMFSPEGTAISYHSNEAGAFDVYVQPFPNGPKRRITTGGRSTPAWRGNELFHAPGGGGTQLFFRTISVKDGLVEFGREQALPLPPFLTFGNGYRSYDVASDGKQFLLVLPASEASQDPQINIVLNWFEELKRRAPAR